MILRRSTSRTSLAFLALVLLTAAALAQSNVSGPATQPQYTQGVSNSVQFTCTVTDSDDDSPSGNGGDSAARDYALRVWVCKDNTANVKAKVTASGSASHGGDQPAGGGRPTTANPTTYAVTVTIPATITASDGDIKVYIGARSPEDGENEVKTCVTIKKSS